MLDGSSAIPMQAIAVLAVLEWSRECRYGKSVLRFMWMLTGKVTSYLSRWTIAMGYPDYGRAQENVYIFLTSYTRPAGRRVYIIQSFHKKN
jgi:hypothetical protein